MSEQKPEKKVVSRTVAIALGIICIVLAVSLVGAIADYTSIIGNNTISSQSSFKEPPPLTIKLNMTIIDNDTEKLRDDLESLGCKIINSTNWGTPNALSNYNDFRRIAYNTGVVFWNDTGIYSTYPSTWADTVTLYTIFDGTILSFQITFTTRM